MSITQRSFGRPDDKRDFPNGHADLVHVGDKTVARSTMQPGWKWSNDIKPIVKTESCQMLHNGVVLSALHLSGSGAASRGFREAG